MHEFYVQKMSGRIHIACAQPWEEESCGPLPKHTEPWSSVWLAGSQRDLAFNWEFTSLSVLWFKKGGPRNIFIKKHCLFGRSIYLNLFIRKLRKLNSIFFYYSTFYT